MHLPLGIGVVHAKKLTHCVAQWELKNFWATLFGLMLWRGGGWGRGWRMED
jgi:hypothetical protein